MGKLKAVPLYDLAARQLNVIETKQETKIIEREVVKIPCKYCGTLVDPVRNEKCPNCGARLYLNR